MSASNQYITAAQMQALLDAFNVSIPTDSDQQDLLDRATADMEADLSRRFVVPLSGSVTDYASAPLFARNKVLNTLRAKIKQLIGYDQNRNTIIDATQKFIDTYKIEYEGHLKALLDPKIDFKLQQLDYTDGAIAPVQTLGLGKADNRAHVVLDTFDECDH